MARVSNEAGGGGQGGVFGELVRLQTEFQARLAEETLQYLRRLQGAAAPATPGTVLLPDEGTLLRGTGSRGSVVELSLEVENRQRVHCLVSPLLGPLVNPDGVTWFPEVEALPSTALVPPGEARQQRLRVVVPMDIPFATYRGALLLQGFGDGALPVAIEVPEPATARPAARRRSAGSKKTSAPRARAATRKRSPKK
ncbi:MAG TPA: hypothetical protein VGF23_02515 [Gaiellaceae bacterium]|jgi:hypothetical protein